MLENHQCAYSGPGKIVYEITQFWSSGTWITKWKLFIHSSVI